MTSANKKDIDVGEVYITLYYDSLSERNKEVAQSVGQRYVYLSNEFVKITMPVTNTTTVREIDDYMSKIAARFLNQK